MRRSRWKDSVLEETLLRYVNFSGGVWGVLPGTDVTSQSLRSEMRLKKAAMEKTDLTGAELFRTSLAGMDLTACTLDRIVLSETCRELKGAVINAAQAAVVARILGIRVEP
ncbi:pentapeptide repeat-containing protein [Oscillibacter sp.]|uniref:pentapeptide repeat-containing protein n=1 Tax=Oscillibacter sp. TaxID=1945593 RepID=UPI00338F7C27